MNCSFYGKAMGNVRNRVKKEIIRKSDDDKFLTMQSNLTFNGIHKPYGKYDCYTFEHSETIMKKPKYLGFVVLKSKLLMYTDDLHYDKLQPYFGETNVQNHNIDTDAFL